MGGRGGGVAKGMGQIANMDRNREECRGDGITIIQKNKIE
jgi:hypothetical protein